jgi:hypothetical protein
MPAGRPTKYNEEILDKAKEYLNVYESLGDVIPSIEGLSLHLDIVRSTIYDWEGQEGKEEFSDILRKINAKQHQVLINKGLSNDFNSAITKLVLGKHGYHEKQQQEISGPEGKPIETASVINFIPVSRDEK